MYNMDTSDTPNLEQRQNDLSDPAAHLSSSTLLSMLSDGQLDMNTLFFSDSLSSHNQPSQEEHVGSGAETFASLFTKGRGERSGSLTV